ncbi:MAG: primosomal protein N', partial [Clostridia bacterium]|nr:primosomal protein N' [Clostridia bacterium]
EHNAVMLLSSATPSVTSYHKAKTGIYTLVELKNRYNKGPLPQVEICDMRGTSPTSPVGDVLADRLREDKAAGNQSILFLNRRGYNHFVSCRSCGKSIQCPHCSVSMTYHTVRRGKLQEVSEDAGYSPEEYQRTRRENGLLACHLCGYRTKLPEVCPVCGKPHFLFMGCGTQKAEDDIEKQFPDLRLIRMDTDTTHGKFSHETYLSRFRAGEADVLLGTQMVTKGHDFPKVATVGVLNADSALFLDDYRASERTFSMLTQVIGRSDRGDVQWKAIIQTWNPDNDVLHLAAAQDYVRFYEGEIRLRKALCFPPFCDIAVITVSGSDEGVLSSIVTSLHQRIRKCAAEEFSDVPLVLFGPFEAPVYRIQNVFRMRFVLKCRLNKRTRAFIHQLLSEYSGGSVPGAEEKKSGKPVGATEVRLHSRGDRRISVAVDLNPSTI